MTDSDIGKPNEIENSERDLIYRERFKALLQKLQGGIIISCQAPKGSPLDDPQIISALALVAERNSAAGVRINSPHNILATKQRVSVPIIGIEKVESDESEVYITPTFDVASRIAVNGADIIAVDATSRRRPQGEKIETLIRKIQKELQKPVMADIATFEEGLNAAEMGADFVATTLCGYTTESRYQTLPAFNLLENLAKQVTIPVFCEGGISSPQEAQRAFDLGATAVVVGAAVTGVDRLVRRFVTVSERMRKI